MGGKNNNPKRRAKAREKRKNELAEQAMAASRLRADMLDLKIAGYTFEQIAESTGQDVKFVRRELEEAIAEIVLPKAEVAKAMMVEQLTRVMPAHYNAAVGGDVGAVHGLIAVVDRLSRLLGLNEPDKHQQIGADGKPLNIIPVLNVQIGAAGPKSSSETG